VSCACLEVGAFCDEERSKVSSKQLTEELQVGTSGSLRILYPFLPCTPCFARDKRELLWMPAAFGIQHPLSLRARWPRVSFNPQLQNSAFPDNRETSLGMFQICPWDLSTPISLQCCASSSGYFRISLIGQFSFNSRHEPKTEKAPDDSSETSPALRKMKSVMKSVIRFVIHSVRRDATLHNLKTRNGGNLNSCGWTLSDTFPPSVTQVVYASRRRRRARRPYTLSEGWPVLE